MKPKTQRLCFFLVFIGCLTLAAFIILKTLEGNLIYFYTPTDLLTNLTTQSQCIRVGGYVKKDSVKKLQPSNTISFYVTDRKHSIQVIYQGPLPDLFAEEQGVIAEGILTKEKFLKASRILAKHDETYMPVEVARALKKQEAGLPR